MSYRAIQLGLLLVVLASRLSPAADPAPSWELSPYRIHVLIAVDPGASLPRSLEADVQADLPARAATVVGGSWRLEASAAPAELRHAMLTDLADVAADRLPASALGSDKLILLAVSESDAGYQIAARELDLTTRLWNSIVTRQAAHPDQVEGTAWQTLLAAFAPLGRIDSVENGVATLRMKAGAIARRDRSPAAIAGGSVFRPVLVNSNTQGQLQPQSAQPIDWTVLTTTTSSGSTATCRIDTGLAGEAIPAYHPARARLALGVAPSQASTRLRLVADAADRPPLEGYELLAEVADPAAASSGQSLGISDQDGIVTIPPGSTVARMLVVRQGGLALARVPVIPGLAAEVVLPLADDRQRLAIDTSLSAVQDELSDLAARRQALAARIKLAKKAGDNDAANKLTPKLRSLASVEPLTAQLDQIDKTLKASNARTQSLLQPKLDALRKLAKDLATQAPTSLLDEPKPPEATGDTKGATKTGDAKQQ
jgi:hypothetical protein